MATSGGKAEPLGTNFQLVNLVCAINQSLGSQLDSIKAGARSYIQCSAVVAPSNVSCYLIKLDRTQVRAPCIEDQHAARTGSVDIAGPVERQTVW